MPVDLNSVRNELGRIQSKSRMEAQKKLLELSFLQQKTQLDARTKLQELAQKARQEQADAEAAAQEEQTPQGPMLSAPQRINTSAPDPTASPFGEPMGEQPGPSVSNFGQPGGPQPGSPLQGQQGGGQDPLYGAQVPDFITSSRTQTQTGMEQLAPGVMGTAMRTQGTTTTEPNVLRARDAIALRQRQAQMDREYELTKSAMFRDTFLKLSDSFSSELGGAGAALQVSTALQNGDYETVGRILGNKPTLQAKYIETQIQGVHADIAQARAAAEANIAEARKFGAQADAIEAYRGKVDEILMGGGAGGQFGVETTVEIGSDGLPKVTRKQRDPAILAEKAMELTSKAFDAKGNLRPDGIGIVQGASNMLWEAGHIVPIFTEEKGRLFGQDKVEYMTVGQFIDLVDRASIGDREAMDRLELLLDISTTPRPGAVQLRDIYVSPKSDGPNWASANRLTALLASGLSGEDIRAMMGPGDDFLAAQLNARVQAMRQLEEEAANAPPPPPPPTGQMGQPTPLTRELGFESPLDIFRLPSEREAARRRGQ